MNSESPHSGNYKTVKEGNDPFNGCVAIFQDKDVSGNKSYWVEHQRKDIYTEYLTLAEAEKKFTEFVDDAQFA